MRVCCTSIPDPPGRPSAGFTLVEALVTIFIIGIVLSILLPSLGRFRASSRAAQCLSNLRETGMATGAIVADNRDLYPFWVANMPPSPPVKRRSMAEVYQGYASTLDVFICPSDPAGGNGIGGYSSYRYWPGERIMDALSDDPPDQAIRSVSMRFRGLYSASILFDRGAWHPGEKRQATFFPDWHAAPID